VSVVLVLQARLGSTRLPGKVLADLGGTTMLGFLIDRLAPLLWPVVVATSDLERDDPVASVAADHGVTVVRGPEQDVLTRYRMALDATGADVIVRLTADCPLLDPALVEEVVAARADTGADYASNTVERCFPDGLDVEAVTADALRAADTEATDPEDREHVTPFIWRRPDRFAVTQVVTEPARGLERWTVDTAEDLARVREVVAACPSGVTAWREVLALVGPRKPPGRLPVPGVAAFRFNLIDHQPTHGALT
jgi:spore coat polysaccharide biosynthesis protein SpsF (cytidylyltransferase family)